MIVSKNEIRKAIQLRIPEKDLNLIDQAARSLGITRTELMLNASKEYANELLLDQQNFVWSQQQLSAFDSAVEASNRTNAEVVALLKKRSS